MHLFALTPRGGHRNHVFLLPDHSDATRRHVEARAAEVSRAVQTAANSPALGDDFIVAWRDVRQVATARVGREWLCLSQVDVRRLAAPQRNKLADWLDARLADLAGIVTATDWQRSAELFEVVPQLDQWQQEARRTFAHLAACQVAVRAPIPRIRRRWLAPLSLVVLLAGVAAAGAVSCRVWRPLETFSKKFKELLHLPGAGELTDKDWGKYAHQLLGNSLPQDPKQLRELLAHQLKKLYSNVQKTDPDAIIKYALTQFEIDMQRKPRDYAELVRSGPPDDLKRLFPDGRFDPTGIPNWSAEQKKFWKDLAPPEVDEVLSALTTANQDGGEWIIPDNVAEEIGFAKDFIPMFNELGRFADGDPQWRLQLRTNGSFRCFYLEKDEKVLRALHDLLRNLANQRLVREANRGGTKEPKTARECVDALVNAFHSKAVREKIKRCRDLGNAHSPAIYNLNRLEKLVDAWGKVSRGQGAAK